MVKTQCLFIVTDGYATMRKLHVLDAWR